MSLSLANRLPELEYLLLVDPGFLDTLSEAVDQVRSSLGVATAFRMLGHPELQAVQPQLRRHRHYARVMSIFYHSDLQAMFRMHPELRATNEGQKKQERQARLAMNRHVRGHRARPSNYDETLRVCMFSHFREISSTNVAYTFAALEPSAGSHSAPTIAPLDDVLLVRPSASAVSLETHTPVLEDDCGTLAMESKVSPDQSAALEPASVGLPACVRVLHPSASQQKLLLGAPGIAQRLAATDLVIVTHKCLWVGAEGCVISAVPIQLGAARQTTAIMASFSEQSVEQLKSHSCSWGPSSKHVYTLGNAPFTMEVASAITVLVDSHAFEGEGVLELPCRSEYSYSLQMLEQADYVRSKALAGDLRAWCLTAVALSQLEMCQYLSQPQLVFEPRCLPVESATQYELICLLESRGWQFRELPSRRLRGSLAYNFEGDEFWYAAGSPAAPVPKPYLLCLAYAPQLQACGISRISHVARHRDYTDMLGRAGLSTLADHPAVPLQLEADGCNALEDDSASAEAAKAESDPGCQEPISDESDSGEAIASQPGLEGSHPEPNSSPQPREAGPEADEPAASIAVGPAGARARRSSELNTTYGHFRITYRQKNSQIHGIFAWCPYHKTSKTVGCTKEFAITDTGDLEGDRARCLNRLHWWCNNALRFDRRWKHKAFHPVEADVLPSAVVEAHQVLTDPPVPLRTDQELDASEQNPPVGGSGCPSDEHPARRAPRAKRQPTRAAKARPAPSRPAPSQGLGDERDIAPGPSDSCSSDDSSSSSGSSSSSSSSSASASS